LPSSYFHYNSNFCAGKDDLRILLRKTAKNHEDLCFFGNFRKKQEKNETFWERLDVKIR